MKNLYLWSFCIVFNISCSTDNTAIKAQDSVEHTRYRPTAAEFEASANMPIVIKEDFPVKTVNDYVRSYLYQEKISALNFQLIINKNAETNTKLSEPSKYPVLEFMRKEMDKFYLPHKPLKDMVQPYTNMLDYCIEHLETIQKEKNAPVLEMKNLSSMLEEARFTLGLRSILAHEAIVNYTIEY